MSTLKSVKEQVQFVSRGSLVRRFHQHPQLAADTDGRHSHGVAVLCALLREGEPSAHLLMAALFHDLAEQAVGDVPAPTKRAMRAQGSSFDLDAYEQKILDKYGFHVTLTPAEQRTLKLADALDGMLACAREIAMGNKSVWFMFQKWLIWLRSDFGALSDREQTMLDAVNFIWADATDRPDAGYNDNSEVSDAGTNR